MKNNQMTKVLSVLCAVVLLGVGAMKLLPSAFAEQYNVGNAEISAAVRNLDINWTSGSVTIAYHNKNTILISEKTTGIISEDMRMRWQLTGDTLKIEYDKPGFHLFSLMPHRKELTVTLPQSLTLDNASIHSTSSDLIIPALTASSLSLDSTSGDIRAAVNARSVNAHLTSGDLTLQVMNMAEEINVKSTSGKISLEAAGAEGKVVLDNTSGDMLVTVGQAGEFKAESTSGKIQAVLGDVKKADFHSTSGSVTVEMTRMEALNVHTTSGDVTAYLSAVPGFTVNVKTASGRFEHQLPMAKEGNAYIAGDGSGIVDIHTASGDITINALENR